MELAIAHVHIHRLEHIYHLLLAPHQFLVGFSGHSNKDRHIKQIFIVICDAVFDVIAGLNRVCQFLIVGTGILHTLDFGAVESDTLSNLIDGLASVLSAQVDVNVHAFTGIDQRRHPTGSYTARITITLDIKECVIETVHNHIVVMLQVNASGSNEVSKADMWHFINTDNLILRCHRIHDNTLHTARKRLINAGTTIEEHIQNFCSCFVRILGLKNIVAALHKVRSGILLSRLHHTVDLCEVIRFITTDFFVLENQKEAPCERFSASDILDEIDVIFSKVLTLFARFCFQFLTNHSHVLIGVGTASDRFEL